MFSTLSKNHGPSRHLVDSLPLNSTMVPAHLQVTACLYIYGGSDGLRSHNSLHQLDTMSWTWKYLPCDATPMPKTGCRMVVHDNKLVLFGGHGFPSGSIQQGSKFTRDKRFRDGAGWTNELHTFDLRQGEISYLLFYMMERVMELMTLGRLQDLIARV